MDDLDSARKRYAELIRRNAGLRSERLVNALGEVHREDFMGAGPWKTMRFTFPLEYRDTSDASPAHLYDDVLVALDAARMLNNGLPSGLARWIDALDLDEGDRVVHAGCGTGYYSAILAHVVGSGGRVVAIECDQDLAARARASLSGFPQVEVIAGDATSHDSGPVDATFVNAGATHPLALWLDNLKPCGRLVFPMVRWPDGAKFGVAGAGWGVMMRIQRLDPGYSAQFLGPAGFYPCFGAVEAEADRLLGDALAQNGLTEAHSLRRDPHPRDASCLLHGAGYCFSRAEAAP